MELTTRRRPACLPGENGAPKKVHKNFLAAYRQRLFKNMMGGQKRFAGANECGGLKRKLHALHSPGEALRGLLDLQ
jgi:hypothetical protein